MSRNSTETALSQVSGDCGNKSTLPKLVCATAAQIATAAPTATAAKQQRQQR